MAALAEFTVNMPKEWHDSSDAFLRVTNVCNFEMSETPFGIAISEFWGDDPKDFDKQPDCGMCEEKMEHGVEFVVAVNDSESERSWWLDFVCSMECASDVIYHSCAGAHKNGREQCK